MDYSDAYLKAILDEVRTVALVGVSMKEVRPSFYVGRYMGLKGYKVLPVNPAYEGESLFGARVAPSLKKLAKRKVTVDMVDIFRRSEDVGPVVGEAIDHLMDKGLKVIWMQIGVINKAAARKAEAHGLKVVMNRCPKIEYQRLVGELSMGGFNSGRISSRLR
ncbi:MAG: CoA-binding protein [Pseudomonadota bacterium]